MLCCSCHFADALHRAVSPSLNTPGKVQTKFLNVNYNIIALSTCLSCFLTLKTFLSIEPDSGFATYG